ncbi:MULTISPECIES: polyprenol monophosphomannose synthase [Kytococcus]|uniref:Polyprenol monophosphomannose synthase n=1 Tax=Kytococcus schroeteri TaxID=138300 RepID=A0A2I1PDT3_9MICO|nr:MULTISPECIES: polyprenol monophosphomannose synthase [Kytococcus]OFS15568.1 dolichol-phosphate mannosyltransferase [Kytococcus sp. HMSC28H12]PKZ42797.1 polyprenol monophosphomannose synthase [Kytococcus schroeteri]
MSQTTARTAPLQRVAVLIPTYNEAENIEWIVGRVRAATPQVDVVVLDDNSPDGTGEIADRMAAADPQVHVLHRKGKEGLGRAYLAGFAWALEQGYDAAVEMDADGSHQPEQLHLLLEAADRGADLVLGSRWVPGGSVVNWPLDRKIISMAGNLYIKIALGMPLGDATGGYRVYRASALRAMDLTTVDSVGYCFQVDMAWRAVRSGMRVVEVPIEFIERERGNSKMDSSIVKESLVRVTRWAVEHRLGQVRRALGRGRTQELGHR